MRHKRSIMKKTHSHDSHYTLKIEDLVKNAIFQLNELNLQFSKCNVSHECAYFS